MFLIFPPGTNRKNYKCCIENTTSTSGKYCTDEMTPFIAVNMDDARIKGCDSTGLQALSSAGVFPASDSFPRRVDCQCSPEGYVSGLEDDVPCTQRCYTYDVECQGPARYQDRHKRVVNWDGFEARAHGS